MRKISWIRLVFALAAAGGITCLWCFLHKEDPFSVTHISEGLFAAAAIELLYSLEFIHTLMGHNASLRGSTPVNAYHRVRSNMDIYSEPDTPVILEYLIVAVLAGAAGLVLTFLF
jgi:hypothetical protein